MRMVRFPYLGLSHMRIAINEQLTPMYISNSIVVMASHTS